MRINIPTDDRFGYRVCYACGTLRTKAWHTNRHIIEPKIILHYLCQHCYDQLIWYPKRYEKIRKQIKKKKEMVKCACGCGKLMPKYNQFGEEKKYYWSSHATFDIKRTAFRQKVYVQCRCGCGRYTKHYMPRGGKIVYYLNGHYQRIKKEIDHNPNPINLNEPDPITQRHNVLRLYCYLKKKGCFISDAVCKHAKRLFLVPLDGNHYNVDIENYVVLCSSHKLLKQKRKLSTLEELESIKHSFYDTKSKGIGKHRRRWYNDVQLPEIEMKKVLSAEQGDFARR